MLNKKLIGFDADQVPTNGMLGTMAFQAFNNVNITGGRIAESVLPTIVSSGKVSDTALSSNVFLKSTAQTLTNRVTFAASTTSVPSLNIPHGSAPSAPTNGDVWTTTTGLFVRINGATEQLAELAANTFTGKQTFPAATTSIASINMPHGTAPSAPVDGDVWTATTGLFVRVNGSTRQMAELGSNTFTGRQILPASTTSASSMNLPHGTAPTAPSNGDLWTTTGGVFCRVNGVSQKLDNQVSTLTVITSGGLTSGAAIALTNESQVAVVNKTATEVTNINLPASPLTGKVITIKDGKGNAASQNTTIRPAAGTIDGQATFIMSTNFQFVTFIYNGTEWNRIG